ncbi:hypothetical protein VTN77DRAFT_7942 [Rasamsonia byssochlamydoides]|uniref:uncharacterized protein n=1 Tax=Rasamsonia byssochlamydoides TaxID=89139 RepID=UPI00374221D6
MAEKNRNFDGTRPVPGSRKTAGSGTENTGFLRKRDSRAGTRKVTSLTAEQLERKRANDREAQRTIRQRTKEHIENLEQQVAELSAKGEQMDRVLERNAALEAEIAHLRQQLAMLSNRRPLYRVEAGEEERRSSTSSNAPSIMSSPFNSPLVTDSMPSGASIAHMPSRMSLSHSGWHSYVPTPSSSACDSDPPNDVGAYPPIGEPISTATIPQSVNPVGQGHDGLGFTVPNATQFTSSDQYHHQLYLAGPQVKQGGFSSHVHHQAPTPMVGQQRPMAVSAMGYESGVLTAAGQVQQQQQQSQEFQGPLHPTMMDSHSTSTHLNYPWDSRT